MAPVSHPPVEICRMPVQQKVEIKESVVVNKFAVDSDPDVCRLPAPKTAPHKAIRQFECEFPTVDANVTRVREALPFPNNLRDVIAWTDVFVDRIAQMSAAREKEYAQLKKVNDNQLSKLELLAVGVQEALEARDTQKARADKLDGKLRRAEAEAEGLHHIIDELNSEHALEKSKHDEEILGLTEKLFGAINENKAARNEIEELKAKLYNEQRLHNEDHEGLEAERRAHEADKKKAEAENTKDDAEIADLKARLKNKTHEHSELKKEFTGLKKKLNETEHKFTEAKDRAEKAENDFKIEQGKKNAMEKQLDKEVSDHNQAKAERDTARNDVTRLQKEVTAAKAALAKVESDLEAAAKESKEKIAGLQTELESNKEKAKTELDAKVTELNTATTSLEKANAEVKRLTTELGNASAKITCLDKDLKEIKEARDGLKTKYNALLEVKTELQTKLNKTKDKKKELKAKVKKLEAKVQTLLDADQEIKEGDVDHCHHDTKPAPAVDDTFKAKYAEADAELKIVTARLEATTADLNKTKEQLDATRKRLIPTKDGYPITIISVEYGNHCYDEKSHPKVMEKLYAIVKSKNPSFQVTNDFFGGDPWRGKTKSCSVDYLDNTTGALKHAHAKEWSTITFAFERK